MGSAIKISKKENGAESFQLEMENPCSLDYSCIEDDSFVSIIAVRRRLFQNNTNFIYHKAWLIIFNNHNEYQYATIEYMKEGIAVIIFKKDGNFKLSQVTDNIGGMISDKI